MHLEGLGGLEQKRWFSIHKIEVVFSCVCEFPPQEQRHVFDVYIYSCTLACIKIDMLADTVVCAKICIGEIGHHFTFLINTGAHPLVPCGVCYLSDSCARTPDSNAAEWLCQC